MSKYTFFFIGIATGVGILALIFIYNVNKNLSARLDALEAKVK